MSIDRNAEIKIGRDDGFTLVELLVVLAIIGLIAAIAAPQVLRYLGTARIDAAKVQMRNISSALELLYIDIGRYPTTEEGLAILVERPEGVSGWNGPYIKQKNALVDGWGTSYQYSEPESDKPLVLWSFGRDKKAGGEGEDADIFP
jgi:general secretion pathway protein G